MVSGKEPKHVHKVVLAFTGHSTFDDAEEVDKILTEAEGRGAPFHLLGREAVVPALDADHLTQMFRKRIEHERQRVEEVLARGDSFRDAAALVGIPDNYDKGLVVAAVKHGVKLVPIELHDQHEFERNKGVMPKFASEIERMLKIGRLSQQLPACEKAAREMAQQLGFRNRRLVEVLPQVAALAVRNYPELTGQRLRMLYALGSNHTAIRRIPPPEGFEVEATPVKTHSVMVVVHPLFDKLAGDPYAPVAEIELMRMVLAANLLYFMSKRFGRGNGKEKSATNAALASFRKADFETLDRLTVGKPQERKAEIIYRYLRKK